MKYMRMGPIIGVDKTRALRERGASDDAMTERGLFQTRRHDPPNEGARAKLKCILKPAKVTTNQIISCTSVRREEWI